MTFYASINNCYLCAGATDLSSSFSSLRACDVQRSSPWADAVVSSSRGSDASKALRSPEG